MFLAGNKRQRLDSNEVQDTQMKDETQKKSSKGYFLLAAALSVMCGAQGRTGVAPLASVEDSMNL